MNILSIDAWRDGNGWVWNDWCKVGEAELSVCNLSVRKLLRFMRKEGYLSQESCGRVCVDDDGYNILIIDRYSLCPLFALAYGEEDVST